MSQTGAKRVLFLHEDEFLFERLRDFCAQSGVELCGTSSLLELGSVGKLGEFDLIVAESYVGSVYGLEIAEYADAFFPGLAVVIVGSETGPEKDSRWPKSVVAHLKRSDDLKRMSLEISFLLASPGDRQSSLGRFGSSQQISA